MSHIIFTDQGYHYYRKNGLDGFRESGTHNYLFDYVSANLSALPELLERYVLKCLDPYTLEIKNEQYDTCELSSVKDILLSAHPYYKCELERSIIGAIVNYFNSILLYRSYGDNKTIQEGTISNEWYYERIEVLIKPLLSESRTYPVGIDADSFKLQYDKMVGESPYGNHDPDTECFIYGVPSEFPRAFQEELNTQRDISNMLYFILDIDTCAMESLSLEQRIWLYSNIFNVSPFEPLLEVTEQLSLLAQEEKDVYPASDRMLEGNNELFYNLHDLRHIDIDKEGIPETLQNNLKQAIKLAEQVEVYKTYGRYKIDSIQQLLYLEVLSMMRTGIMIRKCRNCGKYFVVQNKNIAYCERLNENGVTCSSVGSKLSFQKRLHSEEDLKAYNRAYKTHFARVKSGKMTKQDLELWCKEAKSKLQSVRAGELELENFKLWLKK